MTREFVTVAGFQSLLQFAAPFMNKVANPDNSVARKVLPCNMFTYTLKGKLSACVELTFKQIRNTNASEKSRRFICNYFQ
jgi:hypothetical protein